MPIVSWQRTVNDLPWFWLRLMHWQRAIEGIHSRAMSTPDKMLPPISFDWLDNQAAVEKWFDGHLHPVKLGRV